jgi:hypothetical protein
MKNILVPKSVQGFIDVLKGPAKSNNFFSTGTDASNHKDRRIFPLVVRYFALLVVLKVGSLTSLNKLMKHLMLSIILSSIHLIQTS